MSELQELLKLVGLLDEEIYIAPPEEENGYLVYLQNGERILSLAREKKERTVFKSENRTVRLCDLKYPPLDTEISKALLQIEHAIQKSIKSKLKTIETEECLLTEGIPFLLNFTPSFDDFKIEVAESSFEKGLATAVTRCEHIIKVTIKGRAYYVPCNPKKRFRDNEYYYRVDSSRKIPMAHGEFLFYPFFLIKWLNLLADEAIEDEDIALMLKRLAGDFTYNLQKHVWKRSDIPDWYYDFLIDNDYELKDGFMVKEDLSIGSITSFSEMLTSFPAEMRIVSFAYSLSKYTLDDIFDSEYSSYGIHLTYPTGTYSLYALHHIVSNIQDTVAEEKHRKELRGMVARAYTTKRNIPNHILKEMKNSELNEYFGFIEFDEEVDLSLVDKIVNEFKSLNHHVFNDFKCKNVSLRFRKLGKHRATGLYYPSISTMVVDFRYPQSFTHEYFHLIDDALGNLSLSYDFSRIAMRYQYLLTKTVKDSKKEGSSEIILKGKYDLGYYLRKCEIFARCGEMYLFRNLHVVSSLLKPEETKYFCYPEDEELDGLIEEYYGNLLKSLSTNKRESRRVADEENLRVADH